MKGRSTKYIYIYTITNTIVWKYIGRLGRQNQMCKLKEIKEKIKI